MVDVDELRRGQMVQVKLDRHDEWRDARVVKVPPWSEDVMGETHEYTDKVEVQYPNTSLDGGNFFGDIKEAVPLDCIRT